MISHPDVVGKGTHGSALVAEMDLIASADSEARFAAYVEEPVGVTGHADRSSEKRSEKGL